MKNYCQLIPFIMILLFVESVFANNEVPTYFWDNEQKLVEAKNCQLKMTKESSFNLISNIDPMANSTTILSKLDSNPKGIILANSLISIVPTSIQGNKKLLHKNIKIVGINKGPEFFLQEGYVFTRGIEIQVHEDLIHKLEGYDIFSKLFIDSKEKLVKFEVAIEDEHNIKLECKELSTNRVYTLFNVYNIKDELLAHIAVTAQETSIFQEIRIVKTQNHSGVPDQEEFNKLENKPTFIKDIKEIKEEEIIKTVVPADIGKYICMPRYTYLNARDKTLKKIIYKIQAGQQIKIFQGWGKEDKTKIIKGKKYTFKKIQLYNVEADDQNIAWVAEKYISSKDDCIHFDTTLDLNNIDEEDFIGLDDELCCTFPTIKQPTESLTKGQTKFKNTRPNNRLHAAVDLYRYENEAVVAVAPGKVIRSPYAFYLGTNAIVVKHISGFVVRYGELSQSAAISRIKEGRSVEAGEKLGFIGRLSDNCCTPMLHFELYDGSQKGPLTIKAKWKKGEKFRGQSLKGNARFRRRSDLMDPTKYLLDWHLKTFKVKAK